MPQNAPTRTGIATALLGVFALTTTACGFGGGGEAPAGPPPREEPGPTLAAEPVPSDWKDVRGPGGLVYSVPPDWEIGDPFAPQVPSAPGDPGSPDGPGETGAPGAPSEPGDDPTADEGSDWGSGYITTANAIADRGYCETSAAGFSFRALTGISSVMPGEAREQAESASRAMADSIDRRFTENGADVPVPEARKIGVSNVPAWYVSLRGQVRPPRNECTPPVIRFDTVAVSTQTPEGSPASYVFVLMADEGQEGVQPAETIDAVVASLRFENSL